MTTAEATSPWLSTLLALELAPPETPAPAPKPLEIPQPRGRTFSTAKTWSVPHFTQGHSRGERVKWPAESTAQGRVLVDPSPVAEGLLTDALLAECKARAADRLVVAELVEAIGAGLDSAMHLGIARLFNVLLARALNESARRWPAYSALFLEEIATRRSRHWFSDADEMASNSWLGEWKAPPRPEPVREKPSARYLKVCRLVLEEIRVSGCAPAFLDPLQQHAPPRVLMDARAIPEHDTATALARIETGWHLAFEPGCGRAVPPILTTPGASWRPLPSGAGWLLEVA